MSLPLEFDTPEGAAVPLAGKTALVVNTASACGFTPQYRGLQELWERYRDRGLVVVAVPCNDFGAQEPGSAAEIRRFCEGQFGVTFPITAKASIVDAKSRHPFYRAVEGLLGESQLPRWNFHKYLVGPDGSLLGAWPSKVSPDSPELREAIEAAL